MTPICGIGGGFLLFIVDTLLIFDWMGVCGLCFEESLFDAECLVWFLGDEEFCTGWGIGGKVLCTEVFDVDAGWGIGVLLFNGDFGGVVLFNGVFWL